MKPILTNRAIGMVLTLIALALWLGVLLSGLIH
jgi:hypothetical protein